MWRKTSLLFYPCASGDSTVDLPVSCHVLTSEQLQKSCDLKRSETLAKLMVSLGFSEYWPEVSAHVLSWFISVCMSIIVVLVVLVRLHLSGVVVVVVAVVLVRNGFLLLLSVGLLIKAGK